VIYLDTSALVKLVRAEAESPALVEWLAQHTDVPCIASVLVEVELPRALRRSQPGVLGGVPAVLARLYRYEMDAAVRATAAGYLEASLRSLHAIHLATAEVLVAAGKTITAFVAYDQRLRDAAKNLGLTVVTPGSVR